ncbi:MAG: hypothetical protein Kilf2KO_34910 [Rhodospirillales bacterium]
MRSVRSAVRAAERDAERRRKAEAKAQMHADAEDAFLEWEEHIDELISIHTDLASSIDWQALSERPAPKPPVQTSRGESQAQSALGAFKPKMFDFLRGGSAKLRAELERNVESAKAHDRAAYDAALKKYEEEHADWEADKLLADRLLAGEPSAIKTVIAEMQSLSSHDLVGSAITFDIGENLVHARTNVHGDDIVPKVRRKQLASGRLSETNMPAGEFHALYQNYVASSALKAAGDLFQILPLQEIFVTCLTEMLDTKTGHQKLTPILSVQFVRQTFENLNLSHIDPSDSLQNFNHSMQFKKTKGFTPIEPLKQID